MKNTLRENVSIKTRYTASFLLLLFLALYLICAVKTFYNPDIYFMIPTGKYILEHGFTNVDPFAMNHVPNYMAQQWLSDIIFAKLYDLGGFRLIVNVSCILFIILIIYIYFIIKNLNNSPFKAAFVSALVMVGLSLSGTPEARPQMFTFLFLITELFLLEKYYRTGDKKFLIGLPAISLAVINLHAAYWPMIIIFALPYIAESLLIPLYSKIKNEKILKYIHTLLFDFVGYAKRLPALLVSLCAAIAVAFINPYGFDAVKYGFVSTNNKFLSTHVNEMFSVFAPFGYVRELFTKENSDKFRLLSCLLPLMFMFSVLTIYSLKNRRFSFRHFFLWAGLALMSTVSVKYVALYLIALPIFTSNLFIKYNGVQLLNKKSHYKALISVLLILCILFSVCSVFVFSNQNIIYLGDKTFEKINKNDNREHVSIFTLNTGSVAVFHGLEPYVDTRMELHLAKLNKTDDYLIKAFNIAVSENKKEIDAFFTENHFDYVCVPLYMNCSECFAEYFANNKDYKEISREYVQTNNNGGRDINISTSENNDFTDDVLSLIVYKNISDR